RERLDAFHARRRAVAERSAGVFGSDARFRTPVGLDSGTSAWPLYVLRLNRLPGLDRNSFVDELKERNIGFSVHYRPLHMMSYYREKYGFAPDQFPVAKDAYERMVSLPLHPRLTEDDITDVISTVMEVADLQMAAPAGGRLAR